MMDIYKENRQKNLLIHFIVGLILLFVLRDIVGVAINKYFFLFYCTIFMMLGKHESIIYMLCFMMPLFNGLPGTYILLVALIVVIYKKKTLQKNAFIYIAVFAVLELIAALWYPNFDIVEYIGYLVFISWFFILLYDKSEKKLDKCLECFFFGVAVFCLVVIISGLLTAPSNWLDLFAKGWFRFGETNAAGGDIMRLRGNSNELAYYSVAGVGVGLLILKWKEKTSKIFTCILIGIIFVSGLLSLSRTFIVVMALVLALYIFSSLKSPKMFVAVAIMFTLILLAISKYLIKYPDLLFGFTARFSDSNMTTGGGRTTLSLQYLNSFFDMPRCFITGTGVTQYKDITGVYGSIHNMLIQVFVCYGFVFSIVFFVLMLKPLLGRKKTTVVSWLALIGVGVFVQTIQFINPYALMLPYVIAVYAVKIDLKEMDKK